MALLFALMLLLAPQDELDKGMKALAANQPAEAELLLRKAVVTDPRNFAARFNLALALSLQKKDEEAIAEYRKTLEAKPGLYQADVNLGMLLVRNKRFEEALPYLKEASEAKPKEPRPHLAYGEALLQAGDGAEAARNFQIVVDAEPRNAAAHFGLGRALLKQDQFQEAAEHYRTAAEIDKSYQDALLDLAGQLEKAHADEAIAIYQRFPQNAAAQERLGELLIENKNAEAAIPMLEQAVSGAPTPANHFALGTAYKRANRPDKALEQFRLAVEGNPRDYETRMTYGRELRDHRKFLPAAQQFAAAANQRPDSVEAWNELASVLIIGENFEQGLAALDRVKALGKETPGNHYLRAITLDKLKQLKPALAAYQQFLATDNGKLQDEEWKARQRVRIIENELKKR